MRKGRWTTGGLFSVYTDPVPTRRMFLALIAPAVLRRQSAALPQPDDQPIRDAVLALAELIRPRPKAFLHYHANAFDIWIAATHLKLTIRDAGFPSCWRRQYRIACAVAKDMAHAPWHL